MNMGHVAPRGTLTARVIRAPRIGLGYRLRNLPALWRGYWRHVVAHLLGISHMYGRLYASVQHADGRVTNYDLISTRVVTTAGVNALAASMVNSATTPVIDSYDYHGTGIGTTAEATSDTALVNTTGAPARVAGTPTNPSANIYQSVATVAYTGTLAITEHGLFSASTSGTLLDRSVFSAINVINGDQITLTYQLSLSAGG